MSKSRIGVIFVLVFLATSITFAQSFFSTTTPAQSNSNPLAPPKALSPDDFKSVVKQQNQQTQAQITQQMNQSFSAQPPFQTPTANKSSPSTPPLDNQDQNTENTTTAPTSNPPQPAATIPDTNQTDSYSGYNSNGDTSGGSKNNGSTAAPQKNGLGIQY